MSKVSSSVPFEWSGKELGALVNSVQSSILLVVRAKNNLVLASNIDTNSVISKAVGGMEVEDKDQSSTLVDNDLVTLMLQADISLWGVEPAILRLEMLHSGIKLVEELVSEEAIIHKVELSASIVERVSVSFSWEIEPFWMTKLVALKVEVTLTTKGVCKQTNHLVKSHSSLNDWCEIGQSRHVGVQLLVTEPEEEGLVTDKARMGQQVFLAWIRGILTLDRETRHMQ